MYKKRKLAHTPNFLLFYYLFIKNEVKQINSYPIIYQEQVANLQSNHRRFQVRWIGEFDLV